MINIQNLKEKLITEQRRLEKELLDVARINPHNPADWEPTAVDMNVMKSNKNEVADEIEEYESRAAVSVVLENRLKEVRDALIRIENNKYGICDISGQNIEEDRLEANPAARTCKKYMETN